MEQRYVVNNYDDSPSKVEWKTLRNTLKYQLRFQAEVLMKNFE